MSKFLENFNKTASKFEGVSLNIHEPTFYLDSGNYIINKLLYGSYDKCFPQGRLSAIGGLSSTGKTFIASNVARYALDNNIGVLYIDTERAIDKGHFKAIGIDPYHPLLQYAAVQTIEQTVKLVSTFIKEYRKAAETTAFLIVIDSLDMLETESEETNYEKGEIKGSQGQNEKQLKKMLKMFVHDIESVPMHMICTKQTYVNQDDATKFIEPYKFTEALKFAFSQILTVGKMTLKDKTTNEYTGFTLKAFGSKTRFTKPFQTAIIQVPYDSGMDPYTGILEVAVALNVVEKNGSWYDYKGNSFQGEKGFEKFRESVLNDLRKLENETLNVTAEGELESNEDSKEETPKEIIKRKFGKKKDESNS